MTKVEEPQAASWPNYQGFDNEYEQHTPIALTVKGEIPRYAAGVLYRTGAIGYKIKTDQGDTWAAKHWFDGLSAVHRFQIEASHSGPVQVKYNSRRTVDEYLEMVRKTGSLDSITFASKRDPCKSIFMKFFTMFTAQRSSKNVGVTVSINMPGGGYVKNAEGGEENSHVKDNGIATLHAKTDNPLFKQIDPETLEPVGTASQSSLHPELKGHLSASHAKADPVTGDMFNFNLELGLTPTYRVFGTSAATGETSILATFRGTPAYIHSLFLTENYVVLCVWNSHITWGGVAVMYHKNICDAIAPLDKSKRAMWYVVDRRHGKGLVATYDTDPFFCFHTVNAWEEHVEGKTDIVLELEGYDNVDVIHRYYYDNLMSTGDADGKYAGKNRESVLPAHRQYRLSTVNSPLGAGKTLPGELVFQADKFLSMELPTINPAYLTRKHRFTYGVCDRLKSSFLDSIIKFDNVSRTGIFWETEGHTPSEPIFVPDPNGEAEDDGVILSVVLDGLEGKSYLLCLDARDLSEKGKAEMDQAMAFTFHGTHRGVTGLAAADI
ncbi:carotenoid oxygenase [Sporormia fimetaria CBS 119925]|uniref:Carotenoid oxygenase n=1 Tax=Sporormia fimetaria CBS 119925 TaxID=1340428 RepID=A0A6A6VFM0_9PLEO|nr:carotenoid oxygenase [Sporormia fimetaria CBS 119925]